MLKKEQLEKLLERCMASSCDFAEIFEEEGTTESLSMLNGKLEDTNVLIRAGIGIRLYKGVQSVYGYTNETNEESLNALVDDLRGGFGIESKSVSISLVEETHENLHPIKENPVKASLESKVALMLRANDAAKAYSDKIQKVSEYAFAAFIWSSACVTSDTSQVQTLAKPYQPFCSSNSGCIFK